MAAVVAEDTMQQAAGPVHHGGLLVELLAELLVELVEDPQPAASASAAQAMSVEAPLFIGAGTLA